MEVILIKKSVETGTNSHFARSVLIPSAFISLLTLASFSYSAYQHYSGQSATMQKSRVSTTISARKQRGTPDLALRLERLKMQANELEKRGQRLANKSTRAVDFSLSWDNMIAKKTATRQASSSSQARKNRKNRWNSMASREIKRSITHISERLLLREYRYQVQNLPTGWPLKKGRISSKFGWRGRKMHKGLDIAASRGTPIHAVEEGEVVRAKYVRGYGNLVEIKHSELYSTRYAHNQKNLVKPGDYVRKGQIIGFVGSTGRSTGPHIHFEVRQNGVAINPILYLGAVGQFTLADNRLKLTKYVKLSKK